LGRGNHTAGVMGWGLIMELKKYECTQCGSHDFEELGEDKITTPLAITVEGSQEGLNDSCNYQIRQ